MNQVRMEISDLLKSCTGIGVGYAAKNERMPAHMRAPVMVSLINVRRRG